MSSSPLLFSTPFSYLMVTLLHKGQMDDLHILTAEMNYSPHHFSLVLFYESSFTYTVCLMLYCQHGKACGFIHAFTKGRHIYLFPVQTVSNLCHKRPVQFDVDTIEQEKKAATLFTVAVHTIYGCGVDGCPKQDCLYVL